MSFSSRILLRGAAGTAVALFFSALLSTAPAMSAADAGLASRFKTVESGKSFKPVVMPRVLKSAARVNVVVVMSADSVADVRGRRADHSISDSERAGVAVRVAAQHASVEPAIQAHGGRVLNHFHDALNGIKIEITKDQIASLAAMPGVTSVLPVKTFQHNNAVSVPFIGAPQVWQGTPGYRGEGMKIAIIDTGIDYTHANFGGPGTVAAFTAAAASSTTAADPSLFGPGAPKVKGGIDLVGDNYNANVAGSVPVPDPNPLDCNGHGSHVAGTAAGFGVDANGVTYTGPYDVAAYQQKFVVGPGVAPKADLYAVRVFGCTGTTNVVTEAIDWAVHNNMDVISMSLGADFGTADSADALAASNAAKAGVIVVAASGNAGSAPYITSSPASGDGVIAAAAIDSTASFPAANVALDTGTSILTQDSNGAPLPGAALPIYVLRDSTGGVSLGCIEAEYVDAVIAGKLVVTRRGTCARVLRAQLGQKHGAGAVALINNGPGYGVYEGTIAGVTIPLLGVQTTDAAALTAATTATLTAATLANPTFDIVADFSSAGPRFGDSVLRPGVTAPGVSILSTLSGSGNQGTRESGTSMATPHVSGVAALTRQAHPSWNVPSLTAAIVETGDPDMVTDYAPRLAGSGLVQPIGATRTQAVVFGDDGAANPLSFGFAEFYRDFHATQQLNVRNFGNAPIVFNVTATTSGGVPHTVSLSRSTVRIGGRDDADLSVTLSVPAGTVGATHDAFFNATFYETAGYVTFTPQDPSMNGGVSLHVPYYFVPRARSNAQYRLGGAFDRKHPSANLTVRNPGGAIAASPDVYAWGLSSPSQGIPYYDIRAVGVQAIPAGADSILVFAINSYQRASAFGTGEYDVLIDVNGDGTPDYALIATDLGALTTGSANGKTASALVNLSTGALTIDFLADVPTDGTTVLLPIFASDMGISASNPRFGYSAQTYFPSGAPAPIRGTASFNAFAPAISNGLTIASVPPNGSETFPVAIDQVEWTKTPALGLMLVTQDNRSGSAQASLIRVGGED